MKEQRTLLDCTLRDGGYYNDWDFPSELVNRYLRAMADAHVPVVEIGFRMFDPGRYQGPLAFATDDYLDTLDLPEGPVLGVMSNAADLVRDGDSAAAVRRLYSGADSSPVELVRIAAHQKELTDLGPAVEALKHLGYRVGINLMQATNRTLDEFEAFGKLATEWGADVAYFADSFGGLDQSAIAPIIAAIGESFDGPVGCHLHDNMSMALANTLAAAEAGATWLDATIRGMGRGPGNARTEYLAVEMARRGWAATEYVPLLDLVTGPFADLQREHEWGTNLFYFLSAARGVHPTYIQEMTRDGRYAVEEIVTALEALGVDGGASFNEERAFAAASGAGDDAHDSWSATGWCQGRDVLVVGPGPEGARKRSDIEHFIERHQPVVIALNVVPPVDAELVDVYALCHPVRAMIDAHAVVRLDKPVLMPSAVAKRLPTDCREGAFWNYGLAVGPSELTIRERGCVLPRAENAAYAFCAAAAGGARRILLTGFDGFGEGDPRQTAMVTLLELFEQADGSVPVVALTPTVYPISSQSLYSTAFVQ